MTRRTEQLSSDSK